MHPFWAIRAYKNPRTKGMVIATKTFVLEHDIGAADNELLSVNYYDSYGRLIQVVADNHLGGNDIHSGNYNFTGDVIETKESHQVPGNSMTVYNTYDYDKAKRLEQVTTQITGDPQPVTLQKSYYDELGRLKRKYLHGDETGALQKVDYAFNIRDWLAGINNPASLGSDHFGMTLGYTSGDAPQYNGNISEMYWKTGSFALSEYQFDYDGANRLTDAMFTGTGQHNTAYTYDKNGNITSLTRQGQFGAGPDYGMIDDLTYTYTGNQLKAVQDIQYPFFQSNGFSDNGSFATTEYTYDANGNMTKDLNKNIDSIRYNYLNLPERIKIAMNGLNHIKYLYDATGTKLAKHTLEEGVPQHTTDYVGSFVYEDGQLQYILTEEGRIVFFPDGTHEYQYFLRDHLGNTRVTFNAGGIIQEDSYYPFGMAMAGLSNQNGEDLPNKYLYNGKEMQDDYGLEWYDFGFRFYDPQIARWHVVDPKAEKYHSGSPYNYVLNNPIIFIDPDGKEVRFAKGVTAEFKKHFAKAVQHLNKHGASGMLADLHSSETVYYVIEGKGRGTYSSKTRTITWDPTMGVITNEGNIMSPTAVLNHEVDHANQHDNNPDQYNKDRKTKDPDYKNAEEKRVITGSEQETAKKLGEVEEGQVTRKDHFGTPYETKGPTTTEGKHETVITPEKEKKNND